jgi:hypothetical protein
LQRIAEDEPGKEVLKSKGLISQEKGKEAIGSKYGSHPNLMFPVSGRELAPGGRDI